LIENNKLFNLLHGASKNLILFKFLVFFVLTQTHCVPPSNDAIIAGTKTIQQPKKGLNYQSMIETLSVRLRNRFLTGKDSTESVKSEYPQIYMTSSSIQQNQLPQLNQMIIKDLKQSLEKDSFIVQIPTFVANPLHLTSSECETRHATFDQDIKIILSSKSCDPQADCIVIVLDVSYQGKTVSEMCHLTLTPDLVQKNNNIYHIPMRLGHMKKPYRDIEQSTKFIAETMHCMFNTLLPSQGSHRLMFAKTDNTSKSVLEAMATQWIHLIGKDNIAQTIIPIDCYSDKFVIRDKKISESIPNDIQLLIAVDSMEIHSGKHRIRAHALSLKEGLVLSLKKGVSVPFGNCLPGCRFHIYTYTKSKGKSLIGEGSGKCARDLQKQLWSYSAKVLAERSARQALSSKIKNLLRKHYIAQDLPYHESILDDKTKIIMNNAILEWENFDDKDCHAEARFIIHDSFLPFAIASEPQSITKQESSLVLQERRSVQESLKQAQAPAPAEPQAITSQSALLVQSFNRSVQKHLTQDKIPQPIIQMIETVGFVKRKECISDKQLGSRHIRCIYAYDLTFVSKSKKICVCKGLINGVGNSVEATQNDCVSALFDLLYPFPLDMALALNNKLSKDDLKQILLTLDKKYFQLLEDIDNIIEYIQASQTDG